MPDWKREIRRRLSGLGLPAAREREIVDELAGHLQDRFDEIRRDGASDYRAHQAALGEIDSLEALASLERAGEPAAMPLGSSARPDRPCGGLAAGAAEGLRDFRYAIRAFGNRPAFSGLVAVTLALGIGATAAVFSVFDAVVLRPLPYRDSSRLVVVWGDLHRPGLDELSASVGEFVDYREHNHVFEETAAYDTGGVNLTGGGAPERVARAMVSASVFPLLGVPPALGRALEPSDERPGRTDVALVSDRLWRRRFGADPRVVGSVVSLDGRSVRVVGVMPPRFDFPAEDVDVWTPIVVDADALSENNRGSRGYVVIARLKPGVTIAQATADLNGPVAAGFLARFPRSYRLGFSTDVRRLQDEIVGDTSRALFLLLGAVALLLLVACANVANLLLARASARRKEIAVRAALGASRSRIVGQLLAESLVLSTAGGVLGLGVAAAGVRMLEAMGPSSVPRFAEVSVDGRVVAFTAAISILTAIVFGLSPALYTLRFDLQGTLKEGGRGVSDGGRSRLRRLLVVSETALSLVLLIGAALLVMSFARLEGVSPGFEPARVITARVAPPEASYATFDVGAAFYDRLLAALRAGHGVEAAAAVDGLPFTLAGGDRSFHIDRIVEADRGLSPDEQMRIVTPGYFEALGIPLVAGRTFNEHDRSGSRHVAVVNHALAEKYFGGAAIGHRMGFGGDDPNWYEIVGIVGDVRHTGLDKRPRPEYYVPYDQPLFGGWTVRPMYVVVRTAGDPLAAVPTLREALRRVDRDQPWWDVRTMDARIGSSLAPRRFMTVLLGVFAALALALALLGIAGVLAYLVSERRHEIGVRLALGAGRRDVVALFVSQGLGLAAAGASVGIVLAAALTRLMAGLLYGVRATDPATFAGVAAALVGVAGLASYVPARRAARIDPIDTLREE